MNYNNLNDEDDELNVPPPTPFMEDDINKISQGESYTCNECSSYIEILYIDATINQISFKCKNSTESHGTKTITIDKFLSDCTKNTYIYSKCSSCNRQQNRINSNEVFKYCVNCKLIFCGKCLYNHKKEYKNEHRLINNNERTIKCLIHPNNYNCGYCLDCNVHFCYDCLESREHVVHRKNYLKEIKPTDEEIKLLLKVIKNFREQKIN